MNWLKHNWFKIVLGTLNLVVLFVFAKELNNILLDHAVTSEIIWPTTTPQNSQQLVDNMVRGAWLNKLSNLPLDDWDKDGKCLEATRKQINYLKNDNLSEQFTFDKYVVGDLLTGKLAHLDVNSNKYARTFRTVLRVNLGKVGVNFAGHYSIVSVGMTGRGDSYYIIDRIDGRAYVFPYWAYVLDFKKDSNLIIMDSKDRIFNQMRDFMTYSDNCAYKLSRNSTLVEQKPFYFLWENNELRLLGPTDIKPSTNEFWEAYFD